MNRFLSAGALFVVSTFATSIPGQDPPKASAPKLLTPEDSLNLRSISDLQFSPDGNRLAFVVTEPAKGERRARHIWLYEKQSGSIRQFTYSAKSEFLPRWSPDGQQLSFLSDRDEQQQIYAMRAYGGEASALTKGKRGVQNFAWSPDGKQIAFLAPDAKTEAEEKKEKDKDDAHVADKDDKHARLWLLSLSEKSARAVTPANYQVSDLAWFADNTRLAIIASDHPESDQNTERIFLVPTTAKEPQAMVQLLAPRGPFGDIEVSPSGENISFIGSREDGPSPHDLWILPVGMPAAKNLTAGNLDRAVFAYRWSKDRSLLLLTADGFTRKLVRYTSTGASEDIAIPDSMPSAFTVNDNGSIAFVCETFTELQEIC